MKRIIMVVAVLAILLLVPASSAFGDLFENFNQYPQSTGSAGPWSGGGNPWTRSFGKIVGGVYTPGTSYSDCFTGGVQYAGGASGSQFTGYVPPNNYRMTWSANATCTGSAPDPYVQFSSSLNLTSTGPQLSFWHYTTDKTAQVNFSVWLCSTKVYSVVLSSDDSSYTQESTSALGTIGTTCPLIFRLIIVGSATSGGYFFDNVDVHNANFIFSSANLFMANDELTAGGKPQWYNITGYNQSYVELNTANAQPLKYSNLTAPDIPVKYGTASILKVWVVPSAYFVQIIPNDAGSNTVWLFNPSITGSYTISVQDLSNTFGPGSEIQVSQGTRLLSSGYTDAQNTYPIWIVQGTYQLTITNGGNTYSTTIAFPATSGTTIPVQILKYTQSGNCGQVCQVDYGAGFNAGSTSIVISYDDATASTTSVTDQVWVNGPLGASEFYSHTWSGTSALTDIVPCASDSCNSTLASGIYIVLLFTNSYGTNQENLPVTGGSVFSSVPDLPQAVLAWDVIFPTSPSPLNFAAYLIVLLSAAGMGAAAARVAGILVIGGEVALLSAVGWIPLAPGAALFLFAIGIIAIIGYYSVGR